MKENSREMIFLALVMVLLWGAFWIASTGAISLTSLLLGILVTIIGILMVRRPVTSPAAAGNAFEFLPGGPDSLSGGKEGLPRREALGIPRGRHMLDDGGREDPSSRDSPRGTSWREGEGVQVHFTPVFTDGGEMLPKTRLRRFEATWEQALKEFDPGPEDMLLASTSHTQMAKEFLPGFSAPFEGLSTVGVTDSMPEDILILREAVETRAAPDKTLYRRTLQALMHKDGMCEYRALGKEPYKVRFPFEEATINSS